MKTRKEYRSCVRKISDNTLRKSSRQYLQAIIILGNSRFAKPN